MSAFDGSTFDGGDESGLPPRLRDLLSRLREAPTAPANAVEATGTLTFAGTVADGQIVTIGTTGFEFDTGGSITAGNVTVDVSGGVTATAAIVALVDAIVATPTCLVTAVDGAGDTVVLTALTAGAAANAIATTETCTNASFGAATLEGGVDQTAGAPGMCYFDGTYLYTKVADTGVHGTDWRRVSLGSAY
jgi:hypothetical protein